MSRHGQCPACLKTHALDDSHIATVMRCDCGVSLFVSNATSFTRVPVSCHACKQTYRVSPKQIGKTLKCKCGEKVEVFDTILALPITRGQAPAQQHIADVRLTTEATADTEAATESPVASRPKKPKWLSKLGIGVVVLGFLGALAMFLLSDSDGLSSSDDAGTGIAEQVAPRSKSKTRVANQPSPIAPGLLKKLMAELPVPVPLVVQAEDEQASSERVTQAKSSSVKDTSETKRSPFGGRTTARSFQLPEPKPEREQIPIVPVERAPRVFLNAYQEAFESYEAFNAIKIDSEKSKSGQPLSAEYRTKLGETISLTKNAFALSLKTDDSQRRTELCYLLAYLSHTAGYVMEASIYGEMAARWGDQEDAATHEAVMIALAAAQEANETQWGIAGEVGELIQMETLAELIDSKWPDDDQRDAVWLNLARSYSEFGKPLQAAEAYLRVPPSAKEYDSAKLAAGGAYWSHFLDEASAESPDPKEMVALLKTASKHLSDGVKAAEKKKGKATTQAMSAKLTLATIAERLGESQVAIQWLTKGTQPLVPAPTTAKRGKSQKPTIKIDDSLMRSAYSLLYRVKREQNDLVGAGQAITQLAKLLGPKGADDIGRMHLGVAVAQMEKTLEKPSVTEKDIETLTRLLKPLESKDSKLSVANRLWLAESWAKLSARAATPKLASDGYSQAADVYAGAMNKKDFPSSSVQSAMLRRAELLQRCARNRESLDMITSVLAKSPNIIELQFQAALALEQIAVDDKTDAGLRTAISGSTDATIWGWAKLTTALHQLKFSSKGTPKHAEQLLESNYHYARCQWLLANVTTDPNESKELLAKTKTHVTRLLATTSKDGPSAGSWRIGLEQLLERI